MSPLATSIFCVATLVALCGFDLYLALDRRNDNTYSERIRALGKVWPPFRLILAFSLGVLCSHFWNW